MEDGEIQLLTTEGYNKEDDDKTEDDGLPILLNSTSFHYITVQNIVQRWNSFNKIKKHSNSSMNINNALVTVINDCKKRKVEVVIPTKIVNIKAFNFVGEATVDGDIIMISNDLQSLTLWPADLDASVSTYNEIY